MENSKVMNILRKYSSLSIKAKIILFIVFTSLLLSVGTIIKFAVKEITAKESIIFVTDKERITKNGASPGEIISYYLIYTDKETYELTDSIVIFRWNSSDVYGSIKENTCYSASSYGMRVPLFTWYRNLYNIKEVPCIRG